MGILGSSTAELIFEDCVVPRENLLGAEGNGFRIALETLNGGRIGAGHRHSDLPKVLLLRLGDTITKLEAARLLVYNVAIKKEKGMLKSSDAAMTKKFASDIAMEVTIQVVQIFGGHGYSRKYPVERMMRDAKITQIYEGTNEVQRIVIASKFLKRYEIKI